MATPQEWHKNLMAQKAVEALKKNNFEAEYVATKEEARDRLLALIPAGASIGKGGSMTIVELNVLEELEKRGHCIYNHGLSTLSPEEKDEVRRKELTCDYFICSTNALTLDGKLVNVDGTGNRVAAMIYGPKKVIIVTGINKLVKNVERAIERIETIAAPINCKRFNFSNPCTKNGMCMDCQADTRICNVTTIMHKKPHNSNINVIIVGEQMGY